MEPVGLQRRREDMPIRLNTNDIVRLRRKPRHELERTSRTLLQTPAENIGTLRVVLG